jgi:hypothetical protein
LLLADANDDVVAAGELDAIERGHLAGLRGGDARSVGTRAGGASEHVELVEQGDREAAQEEGEDRDQHPAGPVMFWTGLN